MARFPITAPNYPRRVTVPELRTVRLLLREWRESDLEPFASLNADPKTMTFFPAPLSRRESDAFAQRIAEFFEVHDFGLWAVEVVGEAPFIGFIGLWQPDFEAAFMPATEIGWRIAAPFHRRGFALEGARAVLFHAFTTVGLEEVVSFTAELNEPSWRLMQRLGMEADPAFDFDHPRLDAGSPLRRHVFYRATADVWLREHGDKKTVRAAWTAKPGRPLSLEPGEFVTVGEADTEWPAYRWCSAEGGRQGWVPGEVLHIDEDGTARASRRYSTAELTVVPGQVVRAGEGIGGWTWCTDESGRAGWLPDRVLS